MDSILLKHYIQEYIVAVTLNKRLTQQICLESIAKIVQMNYLLNSNTGELPVFLTDQAR